MGYKLAGQLRGLDVETVAQLRAAPLATLAAACGAREAAMLADLAWGRDRSAVVASGPPKSITCEDSFKSCSSLRAAGTVVQVLAPDLVARVREELDEGHRWPRSFCVKWRLRGDGWRRASASAPLPPGFHASASSGALV